jgi:hypothetical protein
MDDVSNTAMLEKEKKRYFQIYHEAIVSKLTQYLNTELT